VNLGSLAFRIDAWIVVTALVVAMSVAAFAGLRIARRHPLVREVDSTMEAAVFALLGLLLAFTFNMAGTRYDNQRRLIVEEANTIGTAALRSDLYPEAERIGFRAEFREYLESRIADQDAGSDVPRILAARERSAAAQRLLWARASRISHDPTSIVASQQMVPALNQMFDAASRRFGAERARVPESIVLLLFAMCIAATFLYSYFGERARKFDGFTTACFIVVVTSAIYVTLELDRPRRGIINVSASEHSMIELRALF